MRIVYSFSKMGYQAEYWQKEIAAASNENIRFIPFNYGTYITGKECERAQLVDNMYYSGHERYLRMQRDLDTCIQSNGADVLLSDNFFPYHPEFLRTLSVYKVLRTTDGPISAYDRDFAYVHAYNHVLHHTPAFSRDLTMAEKLRNVGAKRIDFWPLGVFDELRDVSLTEETLFEHERDIDMVFVGAIRRPKMPAFVSLRRVFGRRIHMHGWVSWRANFYLCLASRTPLWVTELPSDGYPALYRRAKIGFNIHNRGKFTVGNYRLFALPANGVMQISDGGEYLKEFYEPGQEIVGAETMDDMIDKIRYYLDHDEERKCIALEGFRRTIRDYTMRNCLHLAAQIIERGMAAEGWRHTS
jgi:spore maturation protein CgeB